jgi:hypothetical protein
MNRHIPIFQEGSDGFNFLADSGIERGLSSSEFRIRRDTVHSLVLASSEDVSTVVVIAHIHSEVAGDERQKFKSGNLSSTIFDQQNKRSCGPTRNILQIPIGTLEIRSFIQEFARYLTILIRSFRNTY